MSDKETKVRKIQQMLENTGDREIEIAYAFICSLTREGE